MLIRYGFCQFALKDTDHGQHTDRMRRGRRDSRFSKLLQGSPRSQAARQGVPSAGGNPSTMEWALRAHRRSPWLSLPFGFAPYSELCTQVGLLCEELSTLFCRHRCPDHLRQAGRSKASGQGPLHHRSRPLRAGARPAANRGRDFRPCSHHPSPFIARLRRPPRSGCNALGDHGPARRRAGE